MAIYGLEHTMPAHINSMVKHLRNLFSKYLDKKKPNQIQPLPLPLYFIQKLKIIDGLQI